MVVPTVESVPPYRLLMEWAAAGIFLPRYRLKVVRVDTVPYPTEVVQLFPRGYGTVGPLVGNSVGVLLLPLQLE